MLGRYFIWGIIGLSLLEYTILQGLRAAPVRDESPSKVHLEATHSFSHMIDLIADSRTGLQGSYSSQDLVALTTPPIEVIERRQGETSTMIYATNAYLQELIRHYADQYQIDPLLIELIITQESSFDPLAMSATGAMGLMQLMPETAWSLGVGDPFDPEQNIEAGTRYFAQQLDRFGSIELALAAYNAGPKAVESWGGVPPYPETVHYVQTITSRYLAQSTPSLDPLEQDLNQPTSPPNAHPIATEPTEVPSLDEYPPTIREHDQELPETIER